MNPIYTIILVHCADGWIEDQETGNIKNLSKFKYNVEFLHK